MEDHLDHFCVLLFVIVRARIGSPRQGQWACFATQAAGSVLRGEIRAFVFVRS